MVTGKPVQLLNKTYERLIGLSRDNAIQYHAVRSPCVQLEHPAQQLKTGDHTMHRTIQERIIIPLMLLIAAFHQPAIAQQTEPNKPPTQLAQYPGAPLEDRNGNLWFSSVLKGLIKYDGTSFTNYTTKQGLPSNMMRGMLEADDGTLYFATSEGLVTYDGNAFTNLTQYEPLKIKRSWNEQGDHRNLNEVIIDRNGTLWIATSDGVFKHDGNKFIRFPMPVIAPKGKYEFASNNVSCIYEDREGKLWFGTDGAGVIKYDGESMAIFTSKQHGLASDNVSAILQDSTGDYWFGTANGGVSHYDGKTFTTHLREKKHSIHHGWGRYLSIIEDRQGNIWFGAAYSKGGVYRYDGTDFQYISTESGLGNGGVPSIRQDRSGNLWFGTTAGVYHYDGTKFINFTKNNPVLPVYQDPLKDWPEETFDLPPGFAPDLPNGSESLLFHPNWRKPHTQEYWSYAFVMSIDEPVPDIDRVDKLLETYYTGLMSAFGVQKGVGKETGNEQAQVEVAQSSPNHYTATMNLIDGFATFKPITINIKVKTIPDTDTHSLVSIQLSKQPTDHPVWKSLQTAIDRIMETEFADPQADEATP